MESIKPLTFDNLEDEDLFECGQRFPEEREMMGPPSTSAKPQVQSRLTKKNEGTDGKTSLGFSSPKRKTTAKIEKSSKKIKQSPLRTPSTDSGVHLILSSDEENGDDGTPSVKECLALKLTEVHQLVLSKSKEDLMEFENFSRFSETLFEVDAMQKGLPIHSIILFLFMMPMREASKTTLLHQLLSPKAWKRTLSPSQCEFKQIMDEAETMDGTSPWGAFDEAIKLLYRITVEDYEIMRLDSVWRLWKATESTYRTYLCRREMMTLTSSLRKLESCKKPVTILDSSPCTATTSTSYTPALTQTVLAVVSGSQETRSGADAGLIDFDDEFSAATSRFSTGNASLDISLQKDTQCKTLKAEVRMAEYVYELKLYKKEEIRSLEKSQWYTRVHMKGVRTVDGNHPTKRKLDSVLADLMVDLKQKKNLRAEKTFVYGQKH